MWIGSQWWAQSAMVSASLHLLISLSGFMYIIWVYMYHSTCVKVRGQPLILVLAFYVCWRQSFFCNVYTRLSWASGDSLGPASGLSIGTLGLKMCANISGFMWIWTQVFMQDVFYPLSLCLNFVLRQDLLIKASPDLNSWFLQSSSLSFIFNSPDLHHLPRGLFLTMAANWSKWIRDSCR